MAERYDAVVIGSGPAGEVAVSRLADQGLRVALCERELIGGECAYWACIPSKTLLRPTEARAEARRAAGVSEPELDWAQIARYRNFMIRELDDAKQERDYRERGVDVRRGAARIAGSGRVEVAGDTLHTERIVIATGSDPHIPAIDGLQEAGHWTNREATTVDELPASIVILGGGPVGIELGQFFARVGTRVTLVQSCERLLALDDGSEVRGQELLIATGRRPRVAELGLETVGIEPEAGGIKVDERCRAAEGVWAIGDVTGVMPFTHVGMYQGRVASADIAGQPARADYRAIPRVVFSDPEIAAVGLTEEQARAQGIELASSRIELAEAIARPWTYEEHPGGAR